MSSDNQYTALGPAAVGFQTDGANIAKGAEVACHAARRARHRPGRRARPGPGRSGRGIHLGREPRRADPRAAAPDGQSRRRGERPGPGVRQDLLAARIPRGGDFYLGTFTIAEPAGPPITRCALWLCVSSSGPQGLAQRNGARFCWATRFPVAPWACRTPTPGYRWKPDSVQRWNTPAFSACDSPSLGTEPSRSRARISSRRAPGGLPLATGRTRTTWTRSRARGTAA